MRELCVQMCVCVCVYLPALVLAKCPLKIRMPMYVYVTVYIYIYIYMYVCMYVYLVYMCVHMYTQGYKRTKQSHRHKQTNTHIHTCKLDTHVYAFLTEYFSMPRDVDQSTCVCICTHKDTNVQNNHTDTNKQIHTYIHVYWTHMYAFLTAYFSMPIDVNQSSTPRHSIT